MSADVIIRAEGLGKKYTIGHATDRERYVALRDVLARGARDAWRKTVDMARGRPIVAGDTVEEFWALKDVSFEVKRGEVLGIIGRNGAGKSTLLKILSRITEPSEGRVTIHGRVASLLEVGTGFHSELTGRENIYLNGAILGMRRAEVRRKFDEIVAFSEVEKFLDTPVKHYSSGMYVRLAFSVAAHLEPEILIVDEVLAVGDARFQMKCLGKLSEVVGGGRTVLFVSHNIAAVERLAFRSILLQNGQVIANGPAASTVSTYLRTFKDLPAGWINVETTPRKYLGTRQAVITHIFLDHGQSLISRDHPIIFTLRSKIIDPINVMRVSFTIFALDGTPVGSGFSNEMDVSHHHGAIGHRVTISAPGLAPGRYYFGIAIGRGDHTSGHVDYDVVFDCLPFEVAPPLTKDGVLSFWSHAWGPVLFTNVVLTADSKNVGADAA